MRKVKGVNLGGQLPDTPEEELELLQGADIRMPASEAKVSQEPRYLGDDE